ncbi:MAG: tRNA lysidine(34) synthetase TilS [Chloroflexi bacterium]|jgi:tRNA(Ile)-lysidine synthase|nr:tRNA lysidine(34) synthetase TilS [Chloroflexota bacterium]
MFNQLTLKKILTSISLGNSQATRYVVAYSGGMDSTALLYALSRIESNIPIIAIHINHGINKDSDIWENHCRENALSYGVKFESFKIDLNYKSNKESEAVLRELRYKIFQNFVIKGDWLLTAHHQSDQTETLMLNLFRGSGISGLAAINTSRKFFLGTLVRPLLEISRTYIKEYAVENDLSWLDDPSNNNNNFDRNYLRNEIIPQLEDRWPSLDKRFTKVTKFAYEAKLSLKELAEIDLENVGTVDCFNIELFKCLSETRQRNLIRYSLNEMNLPSPPFNQLMEATKIIANYNIDSHPLISWRGARIRCYRNFLYLLPELSLNSDLKGKKYFPHNDSLPLGENMGQISLLLSQKIGIDPDIAELGLEINFRNGGENICPIDSNYDRKLKRLFQEKKIFPWLRDKIPLLLYDGEVVCVGDLWTAEKFSKENGYIFEWDQRPRLIQP